MAEGIPNNTKTVFHELPFHCSTTYGDNNFSFLPDDPENPYRNTRKPIKPPTHK